MRPARVAGRPRQRQVDLAARLVARHLALGHSDARDFPAAPNKSAAVCSMSLPQQRECKT
jgi:hypothetical protein